MSPRLVAVASQEQPESPFAKDALARLWENAQDRETGAGAVEAIRARRQQELAAKAEKRPGHWSRFLRGGS
jgi:Skp family chaperone for outer membrane proteins